MVEFTPEFFEKFPLADVPFEDVPTRLFDNRLGTLTFQTFNQDTHIPEHRHGAQWTLILTGQIVMTIDGEKIVLNPGQSNYIPSGIPHTSEIIAGTSIIDVFEDVDKFPLKQA